MKFNIGDKVRIVPPSVALLHDNKGKCATIIDCYPSSASYNVVFSDGFIDHFYETWLEKVEEKETDWSEIKEMTEMALAHNKDIVININADGSKEIEITTPTASIVETQMRTRYVPEGEMKNDKG